MYIEKTPKLIKNISEFISDSRAVFNDRCIISPNGLVTKSNEIKVGFGKHFAVTDFKLHDSWVPYDMNSRNIYRFIKNLKKNIEGFTIDGNIFINSKDVDNNMRIIVENKKLVKITDEFASVHVMNDDEFKLNESYVITIQTFKPDIVLSEDEIERLIKNDTMMICKDDMRTRLAKSILPGLKKTHSVDIMFIEPDEHNVFKVIIRITRASMISYHMYSCVKM